ncbi:MAG: bifunctional pyr operon transcriptional regulator/uracil phosphoribosyltransferase PyrR [Candidatus Hydrogenedentes bacterium]|nr:bifunctional pyr operon transcriptional regulator/uracil phosphoribosyltransferase PyrR [Candidatus Hydrogenedentota bacterium]
MSPAKPNPGERDVVMDAHAVNEAIQRLAREMVAANPDMRSVVLLGILSRGRPLADRLAGEIAQLTGVAPKVGSLATTLYRDDVRSGVRAVTPGGGATHFDFSVDGVTVILVDDVLAAGRTVRAALDEVMDYGRPRRIQLACLTDRGGRELPIQPDYLGKSVATGNHDHISVRLKETDGEDVVLLEHRPPPPPKEGPGHV